MASPGSDDDGAFAAPAAVVCCMCGDHGLPHELFRCNLCRLRIQHRYCSDLYPRVPGPYRSCNWCLRQGGGASAGGADSDSPVKTPMTTAAGTKPSGLLDDHDHDHDHESACRCGCCSRSAFSADPGKPIKKPAKIKGRERVVQQPAVTTKTVSKKRREVQPGKAQFRVKVRRYKLLAEVIC